MKPEHGSLSVRKACGPEAVGRYDRYLHEGSGM
jgi:hypothetical protein